MKEQQKINIPGIILKVVIAWMILAFIVLLYTMRGGFKSSVNTDVIQTLVLCIGSIVIIVLLCINFEGQGQTVLWAIKDGMTGFEGKAFDSLCL